MRNYTSIYSVDRGWGSKSDRAQNQAPVSERINLRLWLAITCVVSVFCSRLAQEPRNLPPWMQSNSVIADPGGDRVRHAGLLEVKEPKTVSRVNVRTFGAKLDMSVDDTYAFQAAHDALPRSGGIIEIPPGRALLTRAWNISKPVWLRGSGCSKTHLVTRGAGRLINVQAPVQKLLSGVAITGMLLESDNESRDSVDGRSLLYIDSSAEKASIRDVLVEDVVIQDTPITGLGILADNVVVRNCIIRGVGEHCIYIGGNGARVSSGIYVVNTALENPGNRTRAGACAVKVTRSIGVNIHNVTIALGDVGGVCGINGESTGVSTRISNASIILSGATQIGVRVDQSNMVMVGLHVYNEGANEGVAIQFRRDANAASVSAIIGGVWDSSPIVFKFDGIGCILSQCVVSGLLPGVSPVDSRVSKSVITYKNTVAP